MSKTWFTSDLHLGQKNIIEELSTWEHKETTRSGFKTVYAHDEHILQNINKYVELDDELYIIGDLSFHRNLNKTIALFCEIKCRNIHVIWGNHDYKVRKNEYFTSLFKSTQDYKEVRLEGEYLILSHYAMRVWNRGHRGSIHLYGHSHSSLDQDNSSPVNNYYAGLKCMDVGIDNIYKIYGEYRPISFSEVRNIMQTKTLNFTDRIIIN